MSTEVEANMQHSRRLYEEIFGKGNYSAADELMAADIVNNGPGSPPVLGTEGIKRQAALLRTAILAAPPAPPAPSATSAG